MMLELQNMRSHDVHRFGAFGDRHSVAAGTVQASQPIKSERLVALEIRPHMQGPLAVLQVCSMTS